MSVDRQEPFRPLRRVRSFVLRQGRESSSQLRALSELAPRYALSAERVFDAVAVFGRQAPLTVEIGFGNGAALGELAAQRQECDFVGIEVHRPGVAHLLQSVADRGLTNVRVYHADAVEVLSNCFADASVARFHIFFPDPWPKRRHRKRRLINDTFVDLLFKKLLVGGRLHAATDWEDYARHMCQVLDRHPEMRNLAGDARFVPRPPERPLTKFEQRGLSLGLGTWDLVYERSA